MSLILRRRVSQHSPVVHQSFPRGFIIRSGVWVSRSTHVTKADSCLFSVAFLCKSPEVSSSLPTLSHIHPQYQVKPDRREKVF